MRKHDRGDDFIHDFAEFFRSFMKVAFRPFCDQTDNHGGKSRESIALRNCQLFNQPGLPPEIPVHVDQLAYESRIPFVAYQQSDFFAVPIDIVGHLVIIIADAAQIEPMYLPLDPL